ncbi:MAG TPA: hypothetical protein VK306_00175 [Acidimicrobiales bacterium]|nr:hypothetical protein [Acidimicrobiales bacterium]
MPDKRQTSKQRRAARNRAQREALNARRENAVARAATATAGSGAGKATGAGKGSGEASGGTTDPATVSTAARPTGGGLLGMLGLGRGAGSRRPGDLAVLAALGLSIGAFVMLLLYKVPVDDRGEALPSQFGGVALDARSALTGSEVETHDTSIIDAYGPGIIGLMAVPVVVVAVTTVLNRRLQERNRLLTIAMLALAGMVVLTGGFGFFFLPALIALAVASFQVRKAEMPGRAAQRGAARAGRTARTAERGRGRDDAIDVEEVDEIDLVEPDSVEADDAAADDAAADDAAADDAAADDAAADDAAADDAADVAAPDEPPARRSSGRRSRLSIGSRDRRRPPMTDTATDAAATGDADADATTEPDVLEAEVVAPGVDEPNGDEVDQSSLSGPGPGSSPSRRNRNRRRRGRPAPVVDNPEIVAYEPDAGPDADPAAGGPAAADADPAAVAEAAPEPEVDEGAEHDDILAELEEELRREREAEEADDADERRRP